MQIKAPATRPLRERGVLAPNVAKVSLNGGADGSALSEQLAYVIYTSGSTGRPKGVMVSHAAAASTIGASFVHLLPRLGSTILQAASLSFDTSVLEIFLALSSGATLVIPTADDWSSPHQLADLIEREGVTHLIASPALLEFLPPRKFLSVHTVSCGGEACPPALARRWSAGKRLFNAYGPTEVAIYATVFECPEDIASSLPLGRPIPGARVYLLDRSQQPVPAGVVGELYLGGAGVARGYLARPALTADSFIPDPFADVQGARMYRTGDLARYRSDRTLDFLGRRDDQVKLRGFRVTLGEVESVLREEPGVREAAVIARTDGSGKLGLLAFVVADPGVALCESELRAGMRTKVPAYMTPFAIDVLAALPRTPVGKIDRAALAQRPRPVRAEPARKHSERGVAAAWTEVLGRTDFGVDDNFFDVGGNSLLLVRLQDSLHRFVGREVSVVELFRFPTVESLSAHLRGYAGVSAVTAGRDRARLRGMLGKHGQK